MFLRSSDVLMLVFIQTKFEDYISCLINFTSYVSTCWNVLTSAKINRLTVWKVCIRNLLILVYIHTKFDDYSTCLRLLLTTFPFSGKFPQSGMHRGPENSRISIFWNLMKSSQKFWHQQKHYLIFESFYD